MKKLVILFLLLTLANCQFKKPLEFSTEALASKMFSITDSSLSFEEVIAQYKGKKIVIDVWASWCSDCVRGFPTVKQLQGEYPEVVFLFLSVDKNKTAWKKGIQRFQLSGTHYLVANNFESDFANFLGLNWIPRYVVIDEQGKIALFKATKATDENIQIALKK